MTLTLLLLAAGAVWLYRNRRYRPGAGASSAARARKLRTPAVRIAALFNITTRAGKLAADCDAGAAGERRTAARINPLRRTGWTILHDLALPASAANVDHLAISPNGVVILPDTKRWSRRWPIRIINGRLFHGTRDVTERLNGLRYEARTVASLIGVPVIPLVLMDGAPVEGGELLLDGIRIVPAERACTVLRRLGAGRSHGTAAELSRRARQHLQPYRKA